MSLKAYYKAIENRPYLVITCGDHAAAYHRTYEPMSFDCPKLVVDYAKANYTAKKDGFGLTHPEQIPEWLSEEMKADCEGYFLWNDGTPLAKVKKVPQLPM